jgi:endonuclease/exonuclease/phosphatase (EEP) superfamily protein YafD
MPESRLIIDKQIKKIWYLYTMYKYNSSTKNKIMSFTGKRIGLEIIMLGEISQIQKDKYQLLEQNVDLKKRER